MSSASIVNRLPRVEIEFCTGCKWHLRAGWMAQELLLTFNKDIGEVAMIPGGSAVFIIRVNGEVVFDRKDESRFPEMKEVKQLVRNKIAPEKSLGHSDSAVKSATKPIETPTSSSTSTATAAQSTESTSKDPESITNVTCRKDAEEGGPDCKECHQ